LPERIEFAGLPQTPWANGAGRKADILAGDGWTLAFAWLDGPAPFSDYTGFTRTITLVEGDGFALAFPERAELVVGKIAVPATFDGGWQATCRLLGGPCFVLNAYSATGRWRHGVRCGEPRGIGPLRAGDHVVVLRGQASIGGVPAGPRDTVVVQAPAGASGSRDALVAVVRFDRV
jgi:environmental stress-induced protein Ves